MYSKNHSKNFTAPTKTKLEDGFVISVSPREAQRQLQVSLGLMALMAAAFTTMLTINGLPKSNQFAHQPGAVNVAVQQPVFVRSLTALRAPTADDQTLPQT